MSQSTSNRIVGHSDIDAGASIRISLETLEIHISQRAGENSRSHGGNCRSEKV
jgi:hypothetical protein